MRFLAALSVVLLIGCVSAGSPRNGSVALRVLRDFDLEGNTGASGVTIITAQARYEGLMRVGSTLPRVDFARETVVLLSAGSRPSAGFRIAPRDARVEGETLVVTADVLPPSSDAIVAQVITNPALLLAIEAPRASRVRWVDSTGAEVRAVRPAGDVAQ